MQKKINIYTQLDNYQKENKPHLADILRPFISIDSAKEEQEVGYTRDKYEITNLADNADMFVLIYTWNYYLKSGYLNQANDFINFAKQYNKPILVWVVGDFGVSVNRDDVYILRVTGYQSKLKNNEKILPAFVSDPLLELNRDEILLRQKGKKPIIGFCGQSEDIFLKKVIKPIQNIWHNFKFFTHISYEEPQTIYPATFIRNRALDYCENSSFVISNFIRRKQYKAGVTTQQDAYKTRQDFLLNMQESDYILCVRGRGNFSVRFYEALAMGRIPIFVNTDSPLPSFKEVDWKEICVWVEYEDLYNLPKIVAEFHDNLSDEEFYRLQVNARKIWENYLSFKGFFNNLEEYLLYE